MMIMAIITGNTKTTTPTESWPLILLLYGAVLASLSLINLFSSITPLDQLNERIVNTLAQVMTLPADQRLAALDNLRQQQEYALTGDPAEPFAWARLAYLRISTQGKTQDAFAALRLSDLVSPGEPRQLPERALMWRQLRAVEDDNARAYQTILWQKAFRLQRDVVWQIAQQHGFTAEVGEVLKGDPELYEEWKAYEAQAR